MHPLRNFTFEMVSEADYTWGLCYGYNETSWSCDGMIGMVNRSEVDFALGKSRSLIPVA